MPHAPYAYTVRPDDPEALRDCDSCVCCVPVRPVAGPEMRTVYLCRLCDVSYVGSAVTSNAPLSDEMRVVVMVCEVVNAALDGLPGARPPLPPNFVWGDCGPEYVKPHPNPIAGSNSPGAVQ